MAKMIIVQGVPGSGKSTFVARLVKEYNDRGETVSVFSADHFFMKDGQYCFDVTKLGEAHAACKRDAIQALHLDGEDVIIDNTSTTALEMAFYVDLAASTWAECEIYTVVCDDLEAAAARNVHGVPLGAIKRMAENIAKFHLPLYWKVIHAKVQGVKIVDGSIDYVTSILKNQT